MLATTAQKLTLAAATMTLLFSAIAALGAWLSIMQGVTAETLLQDIQWKSSVTHDRSAAALDAARESAENGRLAYEAALDCGAR